MNEKEKVLISCVGDTDPYRNGYDGAICHIIRKEPKVKKAYLYFSKEMVRAEILNHRYTRAVKFLSPDIEIEIYPKLDKLNEYLNLSYEEIDDEKVKEIDEYLNNEERIIKDAHKFDLFYKELYQILNDVRGDENYNNCDVLFNVSSGTPAMKTSLLLIGILEAKKVTERKKYLNTHIVQVSSPAKSSNKFVQHTVPRNATPEEYKNEDVENIMENLIENITPEEIEEFGLTVEEMDRHTFEDNYKTTQLILYNDVKELFENCDYIGVSSLVSKYENILPKKLVLLAKHLGYRITGRVKEAEEIARRLNMYEDLYPIPNITEREIIEKFNIMKIKNKRDEINDWLLISTPLEERIYIKLLDVKGISFNSYTNGNYKRPKFEFFRMEIKNNQLYKALKKNLEFDKVLGRDINGKILALIVKQTDIAKDKNTMEKIEILENTRDKRNIAAHTISYITRDDIEKDIGTIKNLESIFKFLIKKSYEKTLNKEKFDKALNMYTIIENLILEEFENTI